MTPTRRIAVFLAACALGGCSTLVEGDDQTVSVITDPPEARCELIRGGAPVAFVNPTPGSVVLEKSQDDVSVLCRKDGHFDGMATLSSSFRAMTFGNVVFGGIIGLAVDASSGAMHEYEASVTVVLPPKRFAGAAARDAFFDRQARRIETGAAAAVVKARKACQPDEQDCDALAKAIEAERDARLRELADRKALAAID